MIPEKRIKEIEEFFRGEGYVLYKDPILLFLANIIQKENEDFDFIKFLERSGYSGGD